MRAPIWILALVAAGLSACSEGDTIVSPGGEAVDQIRVLGQATAMAAPDIAHTSLGVQTFADSLDRAIATNNERSEAVIAALKGEGVASKDIRTVSFHVSPQYDYKEDRQGRLIGYWVNNSVAVTVRDLQRVGAILQAGLSAGANQVNGIGFSLADPDSLMQAARVKAVEDARNRAQTLAKAADRELGKAVRIEEASYSPVPVQRGSFDEGLGADGRVPVEPGELQVTAQVSVVFSLR